MIKTLTFISDFGTKDSYVAEVKGVLGAFDPQIQVVDITHWIEPGDITEASFVLTHSYTYFRKGSCHLVVVDPGVGSVRDIIALVTDAYVFVAPDNGVLWEVYQKEQTSTVYRLEGSLLYTAVEKAYAKSPVLQRLVRSGPSATFHGRDLFAPFAGYILCGHPPHEVAEEKNGMVEHEILRPVVKNDRVMGAVVYIDRFGNLISNIDRTLVSQRDEVFIKTGSSVTSVGTLRRSYSQKNAGAPLPLIGSRGYLEIAVNRASAKDYFGANTGDEVLVLKKENQT
jgi:S-adenosylmethionine hydrolase